MSIISDIEEIKKSILQVDLNKQNIIDERLKRIENFLEKNLEYSTLPKRKL